MTDFLPHWCKNWVILIKGQHGEKFGHATNFLKLWTFEHQKWFSCFQKKTTVKNYKLNSTPTLSRSDIVYDILVCKNRASRINFFFRVEEFFFMNFNFKNRCKNEFKDNNEKSCSWSRNRVSHKIDFKAQWPRNGHADSVGVKKLLGFARSHSIVRRGELDLCGKN